METYCILVDTETTTTMATTTATTKSRNCEQILEKELKITKNNKIYTIAEFPTHYEFSFDFKINNFGDSSYFQDQTLKN